MPSDTGFGLNFAQWHQLKSTSKSRSMFQCRKRTWCKYRGRLRGRRFNFKQEKRIKEDLLTSFQSEMCKTARASWELQLGYFRRFPSHVTSLSGFDGGVILMQFTLYAMHAL